jgi:hypothetical protein
MNRIFCCVITAISSILLALGLHPGSQAIASDGDGAKAESPAETVPGQADCSVYDLILEDGVPVLSFYDLQGFTLKPVIDTGDTGILAIFDDIYSKLNISEKGGLTLINGATDDPVEYGIILACLLGSGHQQFLPTVKMKAMKGANFNSVFPLQIFDADSIAFLISRNEIWTYSLGLGQVDMTDNPAIKAVPYSESPSGLEIWISCGVHRYPVKLDTGAGNSIFSLNFVKQNRELFDATGMNSRTMEFNEETSNPSYHLKAGLSILGVEPKDDIPIPEDDYDTMTVTDFKGDAVPITEPGNPMLLPYKRSDAPAVAPVAFIGMDILSDYDFVINQRAKKLYLWSPEETPKLFPKRPVQPSKNQAKP